MPAPAPPSDPNAPVPLPRRAAPRPPAARVSRPRFQLWDAGWAAVIATVALATAARLGGLTAGHAAGSLAAAGTAVALFLLGWRARDRAAGVAAGLLAATSPAFLSQAGVSAQSAGFTLLTMLALFTFVAGSSLAALALAGAATLVRPDGLLLGAILLGLALAQGRKRTIYGAACFVVPLLVAWSGSVALGYTLPPPPRFGLQTDPLRWLGTPAALLLLWFGLPFLGELSEPMRRARWLPVVLWAVLYAAEASLLSVTTPAGMRLPLMAGLCALAGGGVSRLLPTLSGEFPGPLPRYALATLAVLGLVGLHLRLETASPNVSQNVSQNAPRPPILAQPPPTGEPDLHKSPRS